MPITIEIDKDYLYKKGLEKGEKIGKMEGEQLGEAKTKRAATLNLLKLGIEVPVICQALSVSEQYVREIKKEENS